MHTIMIVGGKLQGLEAVYLAKKAGMWVILVDKDENALARHLCDEFLCMDVYERKQELISAVARVDFVLPALENKTLLKWLIKWCDLVNVKIAFDYKAYQITESKALSDELFHVNGIPSPAYYPDCKPPYVVKPSQGSGSKGVQIIETGDELQDYTRNLPAGEDWIIQEFVEGDGFSVEVIGKPGAYRTYEVTTIIVDEQYDCKEVMAPSSISEEQKNEFCRIAIRLAELVELNGIMDVEAIIDNGTIKVLEIDARIPSQTPITVYHSTGINMVEELRCLVCDETAWEKRAKEPKQTAAQEPAASDRFVCFENICTSKDGLTSFGERVISETNEGMHLFKDYCGADEALIDNPGGENWRGIFINVADTEEGLEEKRRRMMEALMK